MNLARMAKLRQFVGSTTGRLAASYLVVIMAMSLGYSLVLYSTSARQLQRQLPPPSLFNDNPAFNNTPPRVNDFLNRRIKEGREELLGRLVFLNTVTLLAGAGLSYYLARRTLKPIEDNMEAQVQFVSDASHELRTPLTAIRTTNEVALRNPKLTHKQSVDILRQNVDDIVTLQALTDGLLALATQGADAVRIEKLSLQDIASEAMNRVVRQAQAKAISVNDQVPAIMVMADYQATVQAVIILLENAIKYSPRQATITLKGVKKGKQVVLQIGDNGPGIAPHDVDRIFDRFYRADQSRSAKHTAGHGIGLALAKKIIEQQGGAISVHSLVGQGSVFSISLPQA